MYSISEKGLSLIKSYEGLKLEAYLCPAKVWTIGYGSTFYLNNSRVKQGDKLNSINEANSLLLHSLKNYEACVIAGIKNAKINQNQFDALVSFTYNVGCAGFIRSTLLKLILINPNNELIKEEFKKWNKAGGKVLNGLIKRRKEEYELYFS
jgi:lysozyme